MTVREPLSADAELALLDAQADLEGFLVGAFNKSAPTMEGFLRAFADDDPSIFCRYAGLGIEFVGATQESIPSNLFAMAARVLWSNIVASNATACALSMAIQHGYRAPESAFMLAITLRHMELLPAILGPYQHHELPHLLAISLERECQPAVDYLLNDMSANASCRWGALGKLVRRGSYRGLDPARAMFPSLPPGDFVNEVAKMASANSAWECLLWAAKAERFASTSLQELLNADWATLTPEVAVELMGALDAPCRAYFLECGRAHAASNPEALAAAEAVAARSAPSSRLSGRPRLR